MDGTKKPGVRYIARLVLEEETDPFTSAVMVASVELVGATPAEVLEAMTCHLDALVFQAQGKEDMGAPTETARLVREQLYQAGVDQERGYYSGEFSLAEQMREGFQSLVRPPLPPVLEPGVTPEEWDRKVQAYHRMRWPKSHREAENICGWFPRMYGGWALRCVLAPHAANEVHVDKYLRTHRDFDQLTGFKLKESDLARVCICPTGLQPHQVEPGCPVHDAAKLHSDSAQTDPHMEELKAKLLAEQDEDSDPDDTEDSDPRDTIGY